MMLNSQGTQVLRSLARDYAVLSVLFQTVGERRRSLPYNGKKVRIHNGRATLIFEHCKGCEELIE
jgi:hypothetical protein